MEDINMNVKKQKSSIIKQELKKELGWTWLFFLLKCSILSKGLFNKSKWGKMKNAESEFLKPYAIVVMFYTILKEKFGKDKAFLIMRNIIVPVGCIQQNALLDEINLSDEEPMKRLMAFNNLMDKKGATQFNDREYVKKDENVCHFKIRRCVFKDFFDSLGVSELTELFCEVDKEFFIPGFPKLKVHRGSSWENTLAYGKSECDFIFERI
ncbi:MAG: L-2-amino-thiazoline-4-carboxylic acid hydrolase [Candidatus Methanocomedens sp.]|jgi:hypothetical protein|nr:MAG: L-2-amino-thiazoline-4-carboxylic acid hydrolase [ANME-2 cluster archaeon]